MQVKLPFSKFQGAGNDFVLIDALDLASTKDGAALLSSWQQTSFQLALKLCDRHKGIGADGLILVLPKKPGAHFDSATKTFYKECRERLIAAYPDGAAADISWIYTNSDGSPAQTCGNGLRCLARFAFDKKQIEQNNFKVATACGHVQVFMSDKIKVDMGSPELVAAKIPVTVKSSSASEPVIKQKINDIDLTCVSMGNPHCVNFDSPIWSEPDAKRQFLQIAENLQKHSAFPQSVNVEFIRTINENTLECYVIERGCGPTLACASGAAACVVAAVLEQRVEKDKLIDVIMPGGTLFVEWSSKTNSVQITGEASFVYSGVIEFELAGVKIEVGCS
ncbi:MAG: diaminopimelate epimerase [Cyanobacteria bacterium TGS_CYA1]|nr:diaminopimelate epimerase [Cyanobacteria bacterium TGS_CYA1]